MELSTMEQEEMGSLKFIGSRLGEIILHNDNVQKIPLCGTIPVLLSKEWVYEPTTIKERHPTTKNIQVNEVQQPLEEGLQNQPKQFKADFIYNTFDVDTGFVEDKAMVFGRYQVTGFEEQAVTNYCQRHHILPYRKVGDGKKIVDIPYKIDSELLSYASDGWNRDGKRVRGGPELLDDQQIDACYKKWPNLHFKCNEQGISRENNFIVRGVNPNTGKQQMFLMDTGSLCGVWVNDQKIGAVFDNLRKSLEELSKERVGKNYTYQTHINGKDGRERNNFEKFESNVYRTSNKGALPLNDGDVITFGKHFWGDLFQFRYQANK